MSLRNNSIALRPKTTAALLTWLALVLLGTAGAVAQERPIKVGGGSMTFLSARTWQPAGQGWCTELTTGDIGTITLEHVYNSHQVLISPDPTTTGARDAWVIVLKGHDINEGDHFRVGPQGVIMRASKDKCPNGTSGPSVTIEPNGGDLKSYPKLPSDGFHIDNHRFADPACVADRDRCERIAEITITGSVDPKFNGTFNCPDGLCHVQIGQAKRVPTVILSGVPKPVRRSPPNTSGTQKP